MVIPVSGNTCKNPTYHTSHSSYMQILPYTVRWVCRHVEPVSRGVNRFPTVEAAEGRTAHNNGWNGANGMASNT